MQCDVLADFVLEDGESKKLLYCKSGTYYYVLTVCAYE